MKEFVNLYNNMRGRIIDLLYPTTCVFCGKLHKEGICKKCRQQIEYIKEPRCKTCGKPVRYQEQEYCKDCEHVKFAFEQGRSLWLHKKPVNMSIYQFKYHNRRIYAHIYARELAKCYGNLIERWGIQVLIPVPLHKKKQWKRGYNQAGVLADYLCDETGIPVEKNAVLRKKYTAPQKLLNDKERKKNLKDAFAVSKEWEVQERVLLIDDIYTTGSTMNAIAGRLKEKGVHKVYFLTISIGQGF